MDPFGDNLAQAESDARELYGPAHVGPREGLPPDEKARYFYDADAVREPSAKPWKKEMLYEGKSAEMQREGGKGRNAAYDRSKSTGDDASANLRNVWKIPTQAFPGSHFATFPPALAKRCILAGTSAAGVCAGCGAPWVRQVEKATGGAIGKGLV